MHNNFYIRFNYKNIIPFNLKKKKLRVHATIIGSKTTNLHGLFINGEVKFWYYYFGINGLKRDNTFLVKKFINKKLGVFFISNFNMIEGKWSFPKIYEEYYKKYLFLKKKKMNLFKFNLILSYNNSYLNNFFYIKIVNNVNIINYTYLYYFLNKTIIKNSNNEVIEEIKENKYNIIIKNYNIINKFNYLYKFIKKYNNSNKYYKLCLYNIENNFNKKLNKFFWNWNFYLKSKIFKKKIINRNIPFWLLKKSKWESDLFYTKRIVLFKEKKYIKNFNLKANILKIIRFIKLNKNFGKIKKKNFLYIFYIFFMHFSFLNLLKKEKNNKKYIKNFIKNKIYKNINRIEKVYNKKIYLQIKQKKNNWINFFFYKNMFKYSYKKIIALIFLKLKKKIKKLYKYKLKNNKYFINIRTLKNFSFLNKNYVIYYKLFKFWLKFNKKKKKKKIFRLYFLKRIFKQKFLKKYTYKKLYLLWLYYIVKKQYKKI